MKNNSRIITIFIFVVLCGSLKAQSPSTIISELKSLLETYNVELTDRWNSNTYSYQYYKTVYTYNIDYAAPIITFTCNWTRKESTCTYYLKSADNFSSVRFSPCLRRFCLILGLEALDMTCMQTPSPYPVRSRGFDLSINEEC